MLADFRMTNNRKQNADFTNLPLAELNREQWEALCDGCARCCQIKLEDEESGERYLTSVVCSLLDQQTGRCCDYPNRSQRMPDCVVLDPDNAGQLDWMPPTCAYRLRAQDQPLAEWHPLVSGDQQSVHDAGISVIGKVISEAVVDDEELEEYVIARLPPALKDRGESSA